MIGGDLDQGGQGDGITNYVNTPVEALEQQQAIDQAISDLGGSYNPMTEIPADPATASAALSGSFFVPTTEAQQQAIDQGSQDQGLLGTISDAAKEAFETVKSGASTAADFITTYGYPVYQALQGNLAAAGASVATGLTPLILGANFAGKIFESVGDTKSKQEYDSYSPEQQSEIDKAYGPGGVMEGYNAVSQFGEGPKATIQSRLDTRRANGISDSSPTSQKLIELQNNLGITDFTQLTQEDIFDRDDVDPADEGRQIDFQTGEITGSPTGDVNIFDEVAIATGDPIEDFEVSGDVGKPGEVLDTLLGPVQTPDPEISQAALTGSFVVPSDSGSDDTSTTDTTSSVDEADVEAGLATESISDFTPSPAPDAVTGDSGGSSGGGKIVCTMMNKTYGFGSFRNKIWLKQSKDLAPEYQKGYHILFLPLVKIAETNKIIRKILEHIAVHRTIDIRQESRGKTHMLGRVYRKILEPICYWVGKYAKR